MSIEENNGFEILSNANKAINKILSEHIELSTKLFDEILNEAINVSKQAINFELSKPLANLNASITESLNAGLHAFDNITTQTLAPLDAGLKDENVASILESYNKFKEVSLLDECRPVQKKPQIDLNLIISILALIISLLQFGHDINAEQNDHNSEIRQDTLSTQQQILEIQDQILDQFQELTVLTQQISDQLAQVVDSHDQKIDPDIQMPDINCDH